MRHASTYSEAVSTTSDVNTVAAKGSTLGLPLPRSDPRDAC